MSKVYSSNQQCELNHLGLHLLGFPLNNPRGVWAEHLLFSNICFSPEGSNAFTYYNNANNAILYFYSLEKLCNARGERSMQKKHIFENSRCSAH